MTERGLMAHADRSHEISGERRARVVCAVVAVGALLLVVSRVLTFPLQRDEQFYVVAGILFGPGLYEDFGFSHLPNLALLLHAIFAALDLGHYLMAARIVIVVGWVATVLAAWRIGQDVARSAAAGCVIVAGLLLNPAFLDQAGMVATNNFLPVPFILWGLWAFVRAVREGGRPGMALLSGLLLGIAAGMKANYAVVIAPIAPAALLMPAELPWRQRLIRLATPMAVGGFIGLLPTLVFLLRDPASFIAHVIAFHRGPQLGYWSYIAEASMPAISLRSKAILATQIWLGGASLVSIAALIYALVQVQPTRVRDGAVLTVFAMLALAVAISFVPTPGFRQYYTLPIPFLLVLFALLVGHAPETGRVMARPVFGALAGAIGLAGLPVLLPSLVDVLQPKRWTGLAVHRNGREITAQVRADGPIATLAPLYVLEGGGRVYPHLAMGPFVYRAMDFVPADELAYYRFPASPQTIGPVLRAVPPAAILTGADVTLDSPFAAFAQSRRYHVVPMKLGRSDDMKGVVLYLRPDGAAHSPGPGVAGR